MLSCVCSLLTNMTNVWAVCRDREVLTCVTVDVLQLQPLMGACLLCCFVLDSVCLALSTAHH